MALVHYYQGLTAYYNRPYKLESDGIWRDPSGKVIDKPIPYFNGVRAHTRSAMAEGRRVYSYSTFEGQYIPQLGVKVLAHEGLQQAS